MTNKIKNTWTTRAGTVKNSIAFNSFKRMIRDITIFAVFVAAILAITTLVVYCTWTLYIIIPVFIMIIVWAVYYYDEREKRQAEERLARSRERVNSQYKFTE